MSSPSRNAALRSPGRIGLVTAVAVLVTTAGVVAGIVANRPAAAPAAPRPAAVAASRPPAAARVNAEPSLPGGSTSKASAPVPLVLTAADRRDCPAAATACADLARHVTWLQGDGKVTFGPVRMEPGKPGSPHQTPDGTFFVSWKAGPSYVSDTYDEAMPWATFFGSDGIAFHGGSLTSWSHGCVHLTDSNAHYYNEHLPLGAEVVVF
jgi:hypothetical protein